MKKRKLREIQDEKRRLNLAYAELAEIGGYIAHAVRLISLQYLVGSTVQSIGADIEITLERANLKTNKTISIQNALNKATDDYFNYFKSAIKDEAVLDWANDLERIEAVVYKFANITPLKPNEEAMAEAKKRIELKYNVTLDEMK